MAEDRDDGRVLDGARRTDQEAIKRVLSETIEQLAQEDKNFTRAKIVFTESDKQYG